MFRYYFCYVLFYACRKVSSWCHVLTRDRWGLTQRFGEASNKLQSMQKADYSIPKKLTFSMTGVNIGRVYNNVKKDIVNKYSGRKHIPSKGFEVENGNFKNCHLIMKR